MAHVLREERQVIVEGGRADEDVEVGNDLAAPPQEATDPGKSLHDGVVQIEDTKRV
jgi:hypothetical protein